MNEVAVFPQRVARGRPVLEAAPKALGPSGALLSVDRCRSSWTFHRPEAQGPDVPMEGMAGMVRDQRPPSRGTPGRQAGSFQAVRAPDLVPAEGGGAARAIGDHTGLRAIGLKPIPSEGCLHSGQATTRSAKRLTPSGRQAPLPSFGRHRLPPDVPGCCCRPGRSCPAARLVPEPSSAGRPGRMKACLAIHHDPRETDHPLPQMFRSADLHGG
jgi:hypothetical protein